MSSPIIESIESLSVGTVTRGLTRQGRTALGVGRNLYRAGLGVVATAQSETVAAKNAVIERYETLVARGTPLEAKAQDAIETTRDAIARRAQRAAERVDAMVVQPVADVTTAVAQRMGVPTRTEVRVLSASVATLAHKVDALVEKLGEAPVIVGEPTVVVLATDEGWSVEVEGTSSPLSVHGTKDEAVEAARAMAAERAPSHLIVYKKDGTIQDKISYHA